GTPAFLFTADGTKLLVPQAEVESIWFVLMKDDASLLAIPDKIGRFYVFKGLVERGKRPLRYTLHPKPGAKVVSTGPVRLSFNRPVFPVGDLSGIALYTSSGDTLRPSVEVHPWQIDIFLPDGFVPGETYTVNVPPGVVQDIEGSLNPQISWSFSVETTTLVEEIGEEILPRSLSLSSNFPNPFNESTVFFYSVPEAGRVVLEVYNMKGQLVESLVDGHGGPGTYRVTWKPEGLASGVYLCVLRSGGDVQVRKLVLTK
ncbi:MAG: hypothetical protein DRP95_03475, partial [Candidatus Latescibacterota bacterium]